MNFEEGEELSGREVVNLGEFSFGVVCFIEVICKLLSEILIGEGADIVKTIHYE
mgnify:CR=1 FL=1